MRNSGAGRILMPYRLHRAGSTEDAIAVAQGAVGTAGNPVVDVDVSAGELVITFNDGTTETHTLPSGMSVLIGIDQTARDAATAVAQTEAADAAQTEIDDHEANHPTGADSTARVAAGTAPGCRRYCPSGRHYWHSQRCNRSDCRQRRADYRNRCPG